MSVSNIRLATLALASSAALSGCAYDTYGDPFDYGYGYGPRSSVSIGIGYGSPYGGYGYGGYGYPYGGYGYGSYGYPYGGFGYGGYGSYGSYDPFGWYGNYYYPGVGTYVYDRYRTRHAWNGDQQRYWTQRRQQWQSRSGTTAGTRENWSGWDRSQWRDRRNSSTSVTTQSSDSTQRERGDRRGRREND